MFYGVSLAVKVVILAIFATALLTAVVVWFVVHVGSSEVVRNAPQPGAARSELKPPVFPTSCPGSVKDFPLTSQPQPLPTGYGCMMNYSVEGGAIRFIGSDGSSVRVDAGKSAETVNIPSGFIPVAVKADDGHALFTARFYQ
jgi:hypothetical protein